MRWFPALLSTTLLVTLNGVGNAQTYSSASRAPAVAYPSPYAPGCATPGMPSTSMPGIGSLCGGGVLRSGRRVGIVWFLGKEGWFGLRGRGGLAGGGSLGA